MFPQFWIPVAAMVAWLVASGTKADTRTAKRRYLLLGRNASWPGWKPAAITASKQKGRDLLREIFTVVPEIPPDTEFKLVPAEGQPVSIVVRRKDGYNFVIVAHRKGAAAREALKRLRAQLPDWDLRIISAEVPEALLTGLATA